MAGEPTKTQARLILVVLGVVLFVGLGLLGFTIFKSFDSSDSVEVSNDEPLPPELANSPVAQLIVKEQYEVVNQIDGIDFFSPDNLYWYPRIGNNPEVFSASRSTGFARTQQGAALAAIHIVNRASPASDSYEATVEEQVTGLGKELYLLQANRSRPFLDSKSEFREIDLSLVSKKEAPLGWTVTSFTTGEAVVEVFVADFRQNLNRVEFNLEWKDDDWRLKAGDAGQLGTQLDASGATPEVYFGDVFGLEL